ncbi:helix-turn-helix domain-containing protein [Rubripirellula amarantea]|nr:helix-turn-helix domain-containing protein [Rubripirellula amarantea]MDA8746218.1 helix-turn-helix domain-containing protein [Rubripirellula amarantea]
MNVQDQVTRLHGMMRVGQAAKYLGVSAETLRNWDRAGRLVATRHPVTGYRYYEPKDLEKFLGEIIKERMPS